MPAILVWGKDFWLEQDPAVKTPYLAVVGNDTGNTSISWSSVSEMKALAARHGVPELMWPVYEGCEAEADIPLDEACTRSKALHEKLEAIWTDDLANDHWTNFVMGRLRDGYSFFIMP